MGLKVSQSYASNIGQLPKEANTLRLLDLGSSYEFAMGDVSICSFCHIEASLNGISFTQILKKEMPEVFLYSQLA